MVAVIKLAEDKQVKCHTCKSTLSYKFTDMQFSLECDYGGGRDRVARINCPVCGAQPQVPLNY